MANGTFSHDPMAITEGGTDQMRFELGDTVTDMEGISAVLCDEEYAAILKKFGSSWRRARYQCLKAIVMKLSFEVDTSVAGLSYNLDQRYARWKKMLEDEEKALGAISAAQALGDPNHPPKPPYFYTDMLSNPRKD